MFFICLFRVVWVDTTPAGFLKEVLGAIIALYGKDAFDYYVGCWREYMSRPHPGDKSQY